MFGTPKLGPTGNYMGNLPNLFVGMGVAPLNKHVFVVLPRCAVLTMSVSGTVARLDGWKRWKKGYSHLDVPGKLMEGALRASHHFSICFIIVQGVSFLRRCSKRLRPPRSLSTCR